MNSNYNNNNMIYISLIISTGVIIYSYQMYNQNLLLSREINDSKKKYKKKFNKNYSIFRETDGPIRKNYKTSSPGRSWDSQRQTLIFKFKFQYMIIIKVQLYPQVQQVPLIQVIRMIIVKIKEVVPNLTRVISHGRMVKDIQLQCIHIIN